MEILFLHTSQWVLTSAEPFMTHWCPENTTRDNTSHPLPLFLKPIDRHYPPKQKVIQQLHLFLSYILHPDFQTIKRIAATRCITNSARLSSPPFFHQVGSHMHIRRASLATNAPWTVEKHTKKQMSALSRHRPHVWEAELTRPYIVWDLFSCKLLLSYITASGTVYQQALVINHLEQNRRDYW